MNVMELERIKHAAAMKAAEGTPYDWVDLLDNTEQYDRKAKNMNESEAAEYYDSVFRDIVDAVRWSDEDSAYPEEV